MHANTNAKKGLHVHQSHTHDNDTIINSSTPFCSYYGSSVLAMGMIECIDGKQAFLMI